MGDPMGSEGAWRLRAGRSLRAATVLMAQTPALHLPAVSRIYYATYQAACAALVVQGISVRRSHGEVWRASHRVRLGLGHKLRALYRSRLAADYAIGSATEGEARQLVAHYSDLTRQLGITDHGS